MVSKYLKTEPKPWFLLKNRTGNGISGTVTALYHYTITSLTVEIKVADPPSLIL